MPCAWVEFAQLCSASGSGQVRNATVALSSIRFGSFRALGLGLWMSRLQDLLGPARVALLGVRSRRGPKFNGCIEFGSVRFDVVVLFCTLPWRCVDCAHGMRVVFALIQKGIFIRMHRDWIQFAMLCSASGSGQLRNATVAY